MEFTFTFLSVICGGGLVLVLIAGIAFGYLAYRRRLHHNELMAMVEKGLIEVPPETRNGKDTLRWGIVITAMGAAFCLGLYPLGFVIGGDFPLNFGPWMLIGLVPAFFGLALILIYLFTHDRKAAQEKQAETGPEHIEVLSEEIPE